MSKIENFQKSRFFSTLKNFMEERLWVRKMDKSTQKIFWDIFYMSTSGRVKILARAHLGAQDYGVHIM